MTVKTIIMLKHLNYSLFQANVVLLNFLFMKGSWKNLYLLEICRVCLVFPPLVSLYGSFHVIIVNSCPGVCLICECVFKSCFWIPFRLGYSLFPVCYLALSNLDVLLKPIILKYFLVCVSPSLPAVCTVTEDQT